MKKGYLSAGNQGSLRAVSDVLTLLAELTTQRSTDSDAIFVATAFQAGIDEFLVCGDHIRHAQSLFPLGHGRFQRHRYRISALLQMRFHLTFQMTG
jgi:hypothetical protein